MYGINDYLDPEGFDAGYGSGWTQRPRRPQPAFAGQFINPKTGKPAKPGDDMGLMPSRQQPAVASKPAPVPTQQPQMAAYRANLRSALTAPAAAPKPAPATGYAGGGGSRTPMSVPEMAKPPEPQSVAAQPQAGPQPTRMEPSMSVPQQQAGQLQGMADRTMDALQSENASRVLQASKEKSRQHDMKMQEQRLNAMLSAKQLDAQKERQKMSLLGGLLGVHRFEIDGRGQVSRY